MRIIYALIPFFFTIEAYARSVFEDKQGNGVTDEALRQGDIRFNQLPNIILAITNNILSYVGYISLFVILLGSLFYVLGGVSEELKSKGKEAIKLALIGAIVSWSGWLIVNFIFDNF